MTKLTLLCLPYSGASAMVYSRWRRQLPSWMQLQPVELPGRGARYDEPLQIDMRELARQLAREHKPGLQAPYALFGHSLGALLACEMAHAFRELGVAEPVRCLLPEPRAQAAHAYDRGFAEPRSDEE